MLVGIEKGIMKIKLKKITIRELVKDYADDPERGVSGYGGRLDIRPEYQREFVYKEKDRDAVIRTVMRGFPLNVMYWAKKKDGTFEVMDGQQRTISICARSIPTTCASPTRTRRASVRSARASSRLRRCAATTSSRGRRAARRFPKTCKCSAPIATPARVTSSEQEN